MGDDDLKRSRRKRSKKEESSDSESSSESEESSSSSASASSESESGSSESESSSETSSESESPKEKKSKSKSKKESKKSKKDKSSKKKSKKSRESKPDEVTVENPETAPNDAPVEEPGSDELANLKKELDSLKVTQKQSNMLLEFLKLASKKGASDADEDEGSDDKPASKSKKSERSSKSKKSRKDKKDKKDKKKKEKEAEEKHSEKTKYKRVDEIWDDAIYDYRLRETSDKKHVDEWNKYIFTVRRKFNCENHYQNTLVDIKSKHLRDCLRIVMEGVQGVSLVEKTPTMSPDMLFLYLEDFREYCTTLNEQRRTTAEKKEKKALKMKSKHLELLVAYLDKDYDEMKKTLYPMLENGTVTFDLLWALYKPNTLAYVTTNGDESQPRTFKMEYITKERHFMRGMYYEIEGKYMDYDGENFGRAYIAATVPQFQGSRKITSLPVYPLKFHQNAEAVRTKLLERGKKYLALAGTYYKFCKGICFVQKDGKLLKANINGRVMVDPKTFRRINPNYPLAEIEVREIAEDVDECECKKAEKRQRPSGPATQLYVIQRNGEGQAAEVIEMSSHDDRAPNNLSDPVKRAELAKVTFTEDELLMLNPLIAGFSFSEKIWVELAVSTISDVQWNDGAFDSLVIPEKHKSIVKALVSSHGQHASKSIDDVISGKGKGLVAVLHGKPGLGKTLTCEAVSDLLKRPLYTVSAGDLGTSATHLEIQLQTILDVAHTWGAVLLLDEADVFLEKRSTHDVHRNALVSIFLRLLEYFQGILILTTNRVETFDEAFVSRIHLSLRYGDLTVQARKSIWKNFINKVAESYAAANPSSAHSTATSDTDTLSTIVPTPGTTSSTPNSGTATPVHASATTNGTASSVVLVAPANVEPDNATTPTLENPNPIASTTSAKQLSTSTVPVSKITEANYVELSRVELNGRQIKNLVKTAQALALYEGVPMGMEHLRRCIDVGRDFELDLKGGRGWEDVMRSYT